MSRLPGRRLGRRAVVPKASKRAKPSSRLPLELILPAFSLLIALVAGPAIRNWLDISTVDPVDALDNAVFDHYRARGAVLHGKVGRACPECLRGIIATKNIRAGEAVFELPKRLAYSLTGEFKDRLQELPASSAFNMAIDVFGNSLFNETHRLWFESMQRNCRINLLRATDGELALLEMPSLIKEFHNTTKALKAAYDGTTFGAEYNSNDALNFVIEPAHVTLGQFLDVGFMVRTRRMALDNKSVMMPLFDMINNAESDDAASVKFFYNATHVGFRAKKHIWLGDELRWNYMEGQRASPDTIFLIWQYVTARTDVLFAEDEQNLNILFGSLSGADLFSNAIDYIDGVLRGFSTTAAEDQQLLRGGDLSDAGRLMVSLRLHRKRILGGLRSRYARRLVAEKAVRRAMQVAARLTRWWG